LEKIVSFSLFLRQKVGSLPPPLEKSLRTPMFLDDNKPDYQKSSDISVPSLTVYLRQNLKLRYENPICELVLSFVTKIF
jgi:hypothetical protein